jgi:hypothetical protein
MEQQYLSNKCDFREMLPDVRMNQSYKGDKYTYYIFLASSQLSMTIHSNMTSMKRHTR